MLLLFQNRNVIRDVEEIGSETESDTALEDSFRQKMISQKPMVRLWALGKLWNKLKEYTDLDGMDLNAIDRKLIQGIYRTKMSDVKFLQRKADLVEQDEENLIIEDKLIKENGIKDDIPNKLEIPLQHQNTNSKV